MSHTFHCHLCKSFRWYKNWHQHTRHQHFHWLVFLITIFSIFSFLSSQIEPLYFQIAPKAQAQTISELNFSGNTDLDVRSWQQRINLQSVTFRGSDMCLNSPDYGLLSGVDDGGGNFISGNVWVIAFINGRWEAGTYEYFRPGTDGCAGASSVNYYGYQGGAVRNTAFTSTQFTPQPGATYGLMISGIARTGLGLEGRNENFISNIRTVVWPSGLGGGGSGGSFDLTRPNSVFYQHLSKFTNAASSRGIYTLLAVYNMWMDDPGEGWDLNPFNPINNINPETDSLSNPDIFITELGLAMEGNTSTPTRQFLRSVWQTLISRIAQNTPNTILFQPLSEPYKDAGLFNLTQFLTQANQWWGKGNLVDNPSGRNDPIHPQAIYRDYHYNFSSQNGASLMGSNTIVNSDTRCDPPPDTEIISASTAAVNLGGNYLVYDCEETVTWKSRVITALNSALGGNQPSINLGQGVLVGYGLPDLWINFTANGSYTNFLDQLRNAGANLTMLVIMANPLIVPELPWEKSTGSQPPPPPPPPPPQTQNAQFISQNVPTSVLTDQTFSVSVTMLNTGTVTWTCCSGGSPLGNINNSNGYKLGDLRDGSSPFWPNIRFGVPTSVAPGQQTTFNFNLTAPSAPGLYNLQWQMVCEFCGWFGQLTPFTTIAVNSPPPPPSDQAPVGWIDLANSNCTDINGWAIDQDTPSTSIDVHLYDSPAGSGGGVFIFIGSYPTNVLRTDVNTAYGITGNHGYSIPTPLSLKDGLAHNIHVFGINSNGIGLNSLLFGSPVSLSCSSSPPP